MAAYRPQFEAALRLFARVSEAMVARGLPRPVLVGGAAVEYYSMSAIATGDFDVTTPVQEAFEEELQRVGFVRPSGAGKSLRGWVHPDLALGFEVVADVPMDGTPEPGRYRLFEVIGNTDIFRIIAVEDLIADRMGQYASGTAADRLDQARKLLSLNPDVDLGYLDRRIREESIGDYGLEDLNP
jgi:hypothetical protein